MIRFISGKQCGFCHQMKPIFERVCRDLGEKYKEEYIEDTKLDDITSVPCIIREDGKRMFGGGKSYAQIRDFING